MRAPKLKIWSEVLAALSFSLFLRIQIMDRNFPLTVQPKLPIRVVNYVLANTENSLSDLKFVAEPLEYIFLRHLSLDIVPYVVSEVA